mgnify:CR=1 FL=1
MELTLAVICLALLQFIFMAGKVGSARTEFDVPAPKTSGPDLWERRFRVHQNTMEMLVIFIPASLIFSVYINDIAAAIVGVLFILSRQWYVKLYMADPESRGKGFVVGILINGGLVLGGLVGLLMAYFK